MRVRLSLIAVLAGALSLGLMACDSNGPTPTGTDTDIVGTDVGDIGETVSSDYGPGCTPPSVFGNKEGSNITPMQLKGYPYPAADQPWSTINLYKNYCDPSGTKNKLLWVSVSGLFCKPCMEEAPAKAQVCNNLRDQGLRCLDVVAFGLASSTAAKDDDVITWGLKDGRIGRDGVTMVPGNASLNGPSGSWNAGGSIAIDKNAANFSGFTSTNSVPINVLVDLRTMKILKAYPGVPVSPGVDTFTTWINGYLAPMQ